MEVRHPKKTTPITYYGGKQKMVNIILPLIPEHTLYAEPFIGGGAVFWNKNPSEIEVINDTNRQLVNFYQVMQNDFAALEALVKDTLHSRALFDDAMVVYENPHLFDKVKAAWSVWVLATMGFASMLGGNFGYDKSRNQTSKKVNNKRASFSEVYATRLQRVQIECTDAVRIIKSRDTEKSFFYCDPPYYNANMGHYDGYTLEDFELLLKTLSEIKGKFLLSSYHSPILAKYAKEFGWQQLEFKSTVTVSVQKKHAKKKIEVLTGNYGLG